MYRKQSLRAHTPPEHCSMHAMPVGGGNEPETSIRMSANAWCFKEACDHKNEHLQNSGNSNNEQ